MTYEIRSADLWPVDFEMRALDGENGLVIEGYAAKFGAPSLPLSFPGVNRGRPFIEILEESAFTRSVAAGPDLTLRYQHNMTSLPLARTKAGTMDISIDAVGLKQRSTLPDNEWGRPVYDAVKRRDIDGMSFRFDRAQDNVRSDGSFPVESVDGYGRVPVRRIRELRLDKELSLTDIPAFPDTSVYARALAETIEADPDDLADAFAALRDEEKKLTPEQRDLIVAAVNSHTDGRVVPAQVITNIAQRRERIARLAG